MSDPYETTEAHLDRLLGRALNSFDLPDRLVERLGTALAHSSSLYITHHSPATGRWRDTHRHTFLLPDGGSVSLWELVYRQEGGRTARHEIFATKAEACLAVARLFGQLPADAASDPALPPGGAEPDRDGAAPSALFAASAGRRRPRDYTVEQSADHARRVLRRAENADRPDERVARLLRSAYAHRITQAFGGGRHCLTEGRDVAVRLYEHGFVLLDGAEVSLWEVEHTATPDGRHMCEVYASEAAAREAMELRARVR
ncbi:DUF6227 family protein [Streptomyces sp. NPDC002990]